MSDIISKHEPLSDDPVLAKEPYTLFEPGTYPATVAKTLDLGVIDSGFGPQSTIEVGFNVDYKGKIVLYSRRFNNTAHRTGNLFKLTSALGVEMEKGFHFRQMIGKPLRIRFDNENGKKDGLLYNKLLAYLPPETAESRKDRKDRMTALKAKLQITDDDLPKEM